MPDYVSLDSTQSFPNANGSETCARLVETFTTPIDGKGRRRFRPKNAAEDWNTNLVQWDNVPTTREEGEKLAKEMQSRYSDDKTAAIAMCIAFDADHPSQFSPSDLARAKGFSNYSISPSNEPRGKGAIVKIGEGDCRWLCVDRRRPLFGDANERMNLAYSTAAVHQRQTEDMLRMELVREPVPTEEDKARHGVLCNLPPDVLAAKCKDKSKSRKRASVSDEGPAQKASKLTPMTHRNADTSLGAKAVSCVEGEGHDLGLDEHSVDRASSDSPAPTSSSNAQTQSRASSACNEEAVCGDTTTGLGCALDSPGSDAETVPSLPDQDRPWPGHGVSLSGIKISASSQESIFDEMMEMRPWPNTTKDFEHLFGILVAASAQRAKQNLYADELMKQAGLVLESYRYYRAVDMQEEIDTANPEVAELRTKITRLKSQRHKILQALEGNDDHIRDCVHRLRDIQAEIDESEKLYEARRKVTLPLVEYLPLVWWARQTAGRGTIATALDLTAGDVADDLDLESDEEGVPKRLGVKQGLKNEDTAEEG